MENKEGKIIEYLQVENVACNEPGGLHSRLLPWAVFVFTVYSIGYPLVVGRILYKNREKAKEDQVLRAKNTGHTRQTNPNCYEFRKRYSKLYHLYKPEFYYW